MSERGEESERVDGLEYKSLRFSVKAQSADTGEFEGLASAFFCIDDSYWGDIIAPGAFQADLPAFLSEGFVSGTNHDWDNPIGSPLAAEENADGLYVRASISDTAAGRDVRTLIKDGVLKRMSIGFRTLGRMWLESSDEVMAWWTAQGYKPTAEDIAKSMYGARVLTRIKLYEFGPVAVPANRRAVISGVKGLIDATVGGERLTVERHGAAVLAGLEEYVERLKGQVAEGQPVVVPEGAGFRRLAAMVAALGEREADAEQAAEAKRVLEAAAAARRVEMKAVSERLRAFRVG